MDSNTEVTIQESEQSGDLFDYIGSQNVVAVEDEGLVEQLQTEAPTVVTDEDSVETVAQEPSQSEEPQAVTTPPAGPANDEVIRLQQRVQELEGSNEKRMQAIALLAAQARQREDKLFQDSLNLMSEEEAEAAKQARATELMQNENAYLRQQAQNRQRAEFETQEATQKVGVATTIVERLGLPNDDPVIFQALMSAQTPPEMVAIAKRLYDAEQLAKSRTPAPTAEAPNVHAAGGESAPAVPPKKVAERSGELIDLMREVKYEYAQQ